VQAADRFGTRLIDDQFVGFDRNLARVQRHAMSRGQFDPQAFMSEERLNKLLERTARFHEAVHAHVGGLVPAGRARPHVAFQAGLLSLEHATGAFVLIRQGLFPSAFTLMRPQYECLVRGIWLLYAASETWVGKLAEPLALESAKRANEGPMLAEMLKELETSSNSPRPIVEQLKQYRDATWKAMNSYAHGGLHPLSRMLTGYPAQLTYDAVRNSNAAMALATQLTSILSGDPLNMEPVRRLHIEFADCLPILGNG
jgi:hypothetical protein